MPNGRLEEIQQTILTGEPGELAGLRVPESYRGVTVHADETAMFEGIPRAEKDPRKSLHVEEVPAPEYALNGGAIPVCVVSSPEKAEICHRLGAELVIDRSAEDYRFWKDENSQNPKEWQRFGDRIGS